MRLSIKNLRNSVSSLITQTWLPSRLFSDSELGWWYELSDVTTLFQDAAGTTPITATNQPVGLIEDKSGNNLDATQDISVTRPVYFEQPGRVVLDAIDDNMVVQLVAPFTGTVLQGTTAGVLHYDIAVLSGNWSFVLNPLYVPAGGVITGMVALDRAVSAEEFTKACRYLKLKGAGDNFSNVTSMMNWFRSRSDITAIYSDNWDTSRVTSFNTFVAAAGNLHTLGTANWDTSNVTNFSSFASGATTLTNFDTSRWNTSKVTTFNNFIRNAAAITTIDVSNWNTSSVTSFIQFAQNATNLSTVTVIGGTGNPFTDSPCVNYTSAFSNTNLTQQSIDDILVAINDANTSNGTFNQSGGSAPSVVGESAITALRSRGWAITVTGGF